MARDPFTLSGQMGGEDVDDALLPHFQSLKRHLQLLTSEGFGVGIQELAFILRGSGSVRSFDLDGPGDFVVNKKDKSISIDIGVPIARWRDKSNKEIANFIARSMIASIPDAAMELKRKGLSVDVGVVNRSLRKMLDSYQEEFAENAT